MTDIPEDIRRTAAKAWSEMPGSFTRHQAHDCIANAILAERKRCAEIASGAMFDETNATKAHALFKAIMEDATNDDA